MGEVVLRALRHGGAGGIIAGGIAVNAVPVKGRLPGGAAVAQGEFKGAQGFGDGAADSTVSAVIGGRRAERDGNPRFLPAMAREP